MSSFCSYFNEKTCQSCRFIEVDYSSQLKVKEGRLLKALEGLDLPTPLPSVASNAMGFRNKAKMAVTGTVDKPIIGLTGEVSLDHGREILDCPVHHPELNKLISLLPNFIGLANLAPYEIKARKGELKGLILYFSEGSGESYLRFVTRSKEPLDRIKKHLPKLQEQYPSLTSVSVNIQPIPHALLEGEEEIFLTEHSYIEHRLDEVKMRLSPKGFVQTNQMMAKKLYRTAAIWTKDFEVNKFAELFCGQGAFSFFIAPFVQESIGFEINAEAVAEANLTVKKLNLQNMTFKCADASLVGEEVKIFKPDMLLVNPPRRGLGSSVTFLKEKPAPYFIYSSCSLESLAKDLKELHSVYEILKIQIFDMFPHTEHFETLVLLKAKT